VEVVELQKEESRADVKAMVVAAQAAVTG